MEDMVINRTFWSGRKVLVTGHTGFKGSWLSLWLHSLGAKVTGYSLSPPTKPSLFEEAGVAATLSEHIHGDVREFDKLRESFRKAQPEIVFHLAAQPLVRQSYVDPATTFSTNVMGTVSLFEAVRESESVRAILNVTTDKCYLERDSLWGYREDEPVGGRDPYSSSKACSELVSAAFRNSFFREAGIGLATARAGNVIGGGDWAKDRIVPDAVRAFADGQVLLVRNPKAIRPWQHVLEALSGYLLLCQNLYSHPDRFADAWNFGPRDDDAQPVAVIADQMAEMWGDGAGWDEQTGEHPEEAFYLKLDCSKARMYLNYRPTWTLQRTLNEVVLWHKAYANKMSMHSFTLGQIADFEKDLNANG